MLNNVNGFEKEKDLLRQIKNVKKESKILNNISEQDFDNLIDYLRLATTKDELHNKMKLPDKTLSNYDNTESLARLDVKLVNDTLSVIRKGKTAYLYYIRYIMLLLKYEPLADIRYHDGIYYCSLDKTIRR